MCFRGLWLLFFKKYALEMSLRDGNGSRCSSVTIVTSYGLDDPRLGSRDWQEMSVFFRISRCALSRTAVCWMGTGVKWREFKAADVRNLRDFIQCTRTFLNLRELCYWTCVKGRRCIPSFILMFSFLGAFAKLRKETISFVMSVRLSIRPSVRLSVLKEQLCSHWMNFH